MYNHGMTEEHAENRDHASSVEGEVETDGAVRPGSALMATGLVIAGGLLAVIFLFALSEGSVEALIPLGFVIGSSLAIVGFCRRLLAALEAR